MIKNIFVIVGGNMKISILKPNSVDLYVNKFIGKLLILFFDFLSLGGREHFGLLLLLNMRMC